MIFCYEWYSLVEREKGEAVKAAVGELRRWTQEPGLPKEVADWSKFLARIICVYLPGQAEDIVGRQMAPNRTRVPATEIKLRERFPETLPGEGRALIYIPDMYLDLPDEALSKARELFDKHGVLEIWSAILRDGHDGLREIYRSGQ